MWDKRQTQWQRQRAYDVHDGSLSLVAARKRALKSHLSLNGLANKLAEHTIN